MEFVAGVSGGTLGYIVGDIPGAIAGYRLGKKLTQNMKRRGVVKKYTKRMKRRKVSHTLPGRRITKHVRKIKIRNVKASGRTPAIHRKKHLKTKFRSQRLKITKKFRKKVKHIILGNRPIGFVKVQTYENTNPQPALNGQAVDGFSGIGVQDYSYTGGGQITPTLSSVFFSPSQFIEAASFMWNGVGLPSVSSVWNASVGNTNNRFMQYGQKIPVVKSWLKMCFKNNTTRVLDVKLYIAKPKFVGNMYNDLNPSAQPVADLNALQYNSPVNDWQKGLYNGVGTGTTAGANSVITSTPYILGAPGVVTPFESAGTGIWHIGEDPRTVRYYKSKWTTDVIKMKIYPGQCIDQVLKGPSDLIVNTDTLWSTADGPSPGPKGYLFKEIQKYCRFVFWTVNEDLVNYKTVDNDFKAGHYPSDFSKGEGLISECKYYMKLGMPESVLRKNEEAYRTGTITANYRHDSYCSFIVNQAAPNAVPVIGNVTNMGVSEFTS